MLQPDFVQIPKPILQDKTLRPNDKLLFGYIYWLTKLKLEKCVASNETLGKLAGISTKSVSNTLLRLEKAGYTVRTWEKGEPNTKRTVHCLMEYRPSNDGGASIKSSNNKEDIIENLLPISQKSLKQPQLEQLKRLAAALGVTPPRNPAAYLPQLNARLKVFKFEEIIKAAENIKADSFMQGDNPGNKKYGTLEFLLRNDKKLQDRLEAKPTEHKKYAL